MIEVAIKLEVIRRNRVGIGILRDVGEAGAVSLLPERFQVPWGSEFRRAMFEIPAKKNVCCRKSFEMSCLRNVSLSGSGTTEPTAA